MVEFLKTLGQLRGVLPRQTLRTLRGQALSGDIEGARKGMFRALARYADVDGRRRNAVQTQAPV